MNLNADVDEGLSVNDTKQIPTQGISVESFIEENKFKGLSLNNIAFESIKNKKIHIKDLRDLKDKIAKKDSITRKDAEEISEFCPELLERVSLEEFTTTSSKTNLNYAIRFLGIQITKEQMVVDENNRLNIHEHLSLIKDISEVIDPETKVEDLFARLEIIPTEFAHLINCLKNDQNSILTGEENSHTTFKNIGKDEFSVLVTTDFKQNNSICINDDIKLLSGLVNSLDFKVLLQVYKAPSSVKEWFHSDVELNAAINNTAINLCNLIELLTSSRLHDFLLEYKLSAKETYDHLKDTEDNLSSDNSFLVNFKYIDYFYKIITILELTVDATQALLIKLNKIID